jgi:hypothetical protein
MSYLHIHPLISASAALKVILSLAAGALGVNPWLECLRGIEVLLELADHICGGDALRFVNSYRIFAIFRRALVLVVVCFFTERR